MIPLYRKLIVLGIMLALVVLTGSVLLEQPAWCVSADGSPVGCAEITLTPGEATGDFYVDGVLVGPARNIGQLLLAPDVDHVIDVKNIQSTEANFGTLFNYADVSTTLKVKAGEAKTKTIKLVKNYIRGTLSFTCDVKGAAETDVVACRVTIDGVVRPDVPAGQSAAYILDGGDRVVLVEVIGEKAILFDPANKQQTVKVTAGKTATLKVTFTKKGHLFLVLDKPDVVADYYVDGTQVATQVAAFDMWVAPNKNHTVEAKNFGDPAAAGVYSWKDARLSAYLRTGADKTVTFKLQKKYLKGFLDLTCDIKNYAGEDVRCTVTIDEIPQGEIAAGQKVTYTLDPGQHNWQVALVGGNASLWAPPSLAKSVSITASATPRKVSATFQKAGHLIVALDQAGVVGDFYVDGVLVAGQVPSIAQWVTPSTSHKLEIKNVNDPAAQGVYRWKDVSTTATARPGEEKSVTVKLVKEWLKGFLTFNCKTDNEHPGVALMGCAPFIDGVQMAPIADGQSATYTLDPGPHTIQGAVTVIQWYNCGSLRWIWPDEQTKNVTAGKTTIFNYLQHIEWLWWC